MRTGFIVAAGAAMLVNSYTADACIISVDRNVSDVRYADAIVVGKLSKYRIVPDTTARQRRRQYLATATDLSRQERKELSGQKNFLGDYARFEIVVDEVFLGKVPNVISVTWDNSTFGEPEKMPAGRYMVAIRRPTSIVPPLRGPSATIMPPKDLQSFTVLQAPCAGAFIFLNTDANAQAVREALRPKPKQKALPPKPSRPWWMFWG